MHPTTRISLSLGWTLASGLVLCASATTQVGDEPAGPATPAPAVPVVSVVGPAPLAQADDFERDAMVQGPWRETPELERDDAVPSAGRELSLAGPDGDRRVEGAIVDPYFLGFAAGSYRPAEGERIDPELALLAASTPVDGRSDASVYAFVMFSRRITPARVAELEALGLRNLGLHPHHSLKVAVPVDALETVAALPFVRWIGTARVWQKLHPVLSAELARTDGPAELDLWVSVFESDLNAVSDAQPVARFESSDPSGAVVVPEAAVAGRLRTRGWQERALEALGLQIEEYSDDTRSFRTRVQRAQVQDLTQLDFVHFLSPVLDGRPAHDESMPLVGADSARATYDGGSDSAVVVGVADTGLTNTHTGFFPLWAAGWDFTVEGLGAWFDGGTHGSHVAGTAIGRGNVEDSWAGAAPGVGGWGPTGRLFNYKVIDSNDSMVGLNWNTVHSYMSQGWTDGNGDETPRPHVINHSWGSAETPGGWFGTEPQAVAFDQAVYDHGQLHVFAAHNHGPAASTVSAQGSAKNVLTVGGVVDFNSLSQGLPGSMYTSSSRGPTADGRWKPNVVAPATLIRSIQPLTDDDYSNGTGTSMATPHVTGIAAQLLDHYPFLRYRPATTAALLMATAITKDDASIDDEDDPHLDSYGAGRVDAGRAHFSTSQQELSFWGWSSADGASTLDVDIVVGPGATRLTAAFVYHEPGASVGASEALLNDWDLWIDRQPFTAAGNSGEYFAHQSSSNNVELRTIDAPPTGSYRLKLYPEDVNDTCRLGLAVSVIYGDTTPNGTLSVTASDAYVQPGEDVVFEAEAYNPSFWASAVFFNSSSTIGMVLEDATATLADGATASFLDNEHDGRDVLVGDIRHGQSRAVQWTANWATQGQKSWSVTANSDNWLDKTEQVQVIVDGTDPGLVTVLTSTSHTPGVWSNDASIDYTWNPAVDLLAGVDGYGVFTSNAPTGGPSAAKDIEAVTSYGEVLATDDLPYYFKVRTVDNAGNWSDDFAVTGGYLIDTLAPTGAVALASISHQIGVESCQTEITMTWSPAGDAHSGIAGYIPLWNHAPGTVPGAGTQLDAGATSHAQTLAEGDDWYFHLRSVDVAGNLGATVHSGPYSIDLSQWTTYCTAKVTSSLCTPSISAAGAASLGAPLGFSIESTLLEPQKNAIGFFGLSGQAAAPFQGGFLCVQAPVYRLGLKTTGGAGDCTGQIAYTLADLLGHPTGGALIAPASVVNMQSWFRDPPASFGSGLSNGIQFLVCP